MVLLGACGCQHRNPPPPPAGGMNLALSLPPPNLTLQAPEMSRRAPNLRVDPSWLDLDAFFPPGAKRVGPTLRVTHSLAPERRTRFPSTELCTSLDNRFVLFHDGMKRTHEIYHWLMLLKHDAPFPNAIFCTPLAFDVTWSSDSRRFAVTHFVGDNSSEVFTVDTSDLLRKPIDVRPFLEEHFPAQAASVPMFLKAYRWTRDGRLIVRGIGRTREPPFELFGCEVAVAFVGPDADVRTSFLRGYIKSQEEE
jgi:hypothetical protein